MLSPTLLGLSLLVDLNLLYIILLIGGGGWFLFTGAIAYFAGNSKFESARIAGRRGLFTFSIMMIVTIFALAITGKIIWDQQFYHFMKFFVVGMMAAAVFAVPLDYGVAFVKGLKKSKRYDSI